MLNEPHPWSNKILQAQIEAWQHVERATQRLARAPQKGYALRACYEVISEAQDQVSSIEKAINDRHLSEALTRPAQPLPQSFFDSYRRSYEISDKITVTKIEDLA